MSMPSSSSHGRLVLVYGPPGVGKFSVGRELAQTTGFKLFYNHLSSNLVSAVFPLDSEVFHPLVRRIRRDVIAEATREGIDLIHTGAYKGIEDRETVRFLVEPVWEGGGSVLFVHLTAARQELMRRITTESRQAYGKFTDEEILADFLDRYDVVANLPFEPHLSIDSTHLTPVEVAAQVAAHYALIPAGSG